MEHYLESGNTKHVVMTGGEYAGLICLAALGVVSIMSSIANQAYSLGRDAKEREMKREFKKYVKKEKKRKEEESY